MAHNILQRGDRGSEVIDLQELLWNNGSVGPDNSFWRTRIVKALGIAGPHEAKAKGAFLDGHFGQWTEEAVKHAQLRLLGPGKMPLDQLISTPGLVDLDTWWALENSTPLVQDQGVQEAPRRTGGLGPLILEVWEHYISLGIREEPKGSNRGPIVRSFWAGGNGGIDGWTGYQYKDNFRVSGIRGPAWCCYARCGIEWEAQGYLTGEGKYIHSKNRQGHCMTNFRWAKKAGIAVPIQKVVNGEFHLPVGAAFIMSYGGSRGHTGSVARVVYDGSSAVAIETCEGNISDAVGRRRRTLKGSAIIGFIVSPEVLTEADFEGVPAGDVLTSSEREKTR